jgi:hypothetical protein
VCALAVVGSACTAGELDTSEPGCQSRKSIFVLIAQAVPSATLIPCTEGYPEGWTFGGSKTSSGAFRFFLDSDRAGLHAVEVTLMRSCDRGRAVEVLPAPDEVGTRRFEEPIELPPNFRANRYYTFPGGCIEVRYRFAGTADPALVLEADQILGFAERSLVVSEVAKGGFIVCGAEAPPCVGETGSGDG